MKSLSKLIFLSMVISLYIIESKGQDAADFANTALDLSRATPGGSARILGLGEAQTSLGGDISSISGNPAGLGFFNRSEVSISNTFNYLSSSSKYLGASTDDARLNFNFGNLGVVIKSSKGSGKFKGGAFGISINRIADFQNQITYEGNSFNNLDANDNIIFDPNRPADFVEYAVLTSNSDASGNISFDNDFAELAYETFLISSFQDGNGDYFVDRDFYAVDENGDLITDGNGNFIPAYSEPNFPVFQAESIKSTGATYQTSFAYGGNYNDRLYFGGNVGILTMSRSVKRDYSEKPTDADLNSLLLEDNYELNGSGVVATVGLIGRPINPLLIGLSYTTPSYYAIEQIRNITLTANYEGNDIQSYGFDYEPFNYAIITPSRLRLGLTYFFGKYGFITGDIENINYTGAKLSNVDIDLSFSDANQTINTYESVTNYRLGAEFRYEIFRLRGGFSYSADPIKNNYDESEGKISFGGGIRTEKFFMDLAVISSQGKESSISPYPSQEAIVNNKNTGVTITAGVFF
jgi:hypothetical protein